MDSFNWGREIENVVFQFYWVYVCNNIIIPCKVVFFYLVLLLLDRIGNLLAYVAALLVASFWGFYESVAEGLVRETRIC